jgi:hypothetical protein
MTEGERLRHVACKEIDETLKTSLRQMGNKDPVGKFGAG